MERFTQVKLVMISEDVAQGMQELNDSIKDMEFKGHQVKDVRPFLSSPVMWVITYQYNNGGADDARGELKEVAN